MLIGFRSSNHPQQVSKRGARPEVDNRATAPAVFGPLMERFRFTIDVAASADNAKCARHFSIADDGLAQSWAGERVWCNPPYSSIEPWLVKAWEEAPGICREEDETAELIVMIVPANRTEQGWWQRWVEPFRRDGSLEVEFLPGRIRFIAPGCEEIGPNERPPFGCCLLIWRDDA